MLSRPKRSQPKRTSTLWSALLIRNQLDKTSKEAMDELLLRRYYPYIVHCAESEIKRLNLGIFIPEDIAGDFVEAKYFSGRLFRNLERGKGSFHAYLRTCVRRFILDKLRKHNRHIQTTLDFDLVVPAVTGVSDTEESASADREFLCHLVRETLHVVEHACQKSQDETAWALFYESWVSPIFEGIQVPANDHLRAKYNILNDQQLQTMRTRVMRRFRAALRVRALEYLNRAGSGDNPGLLALHRLFHPRSKKLTSEWREHIRALFTVNTTDLPPALDKMRPLVSLFLEAEKRRVNRALRKKDIRYKEKTDGDDGI